MRKGLLRVFLNFGVATLSLSFLMWWWVSNVINSRRRSETSQLSESLKTDIPEKLVKQDILDMTTSQDDWRK